MLKTNQNVTESRHGPSREGSTSSGSRRKDYWYYDSSPLKPNQIILDTKLRPRPDNERDGVSSEPQSELGIKRELSQDSSTIQKAAKNRKVTSVAVEVYRSTPIRDRSTLSHETEISLSNANGSLMRDNRLLRRENNLLNVYHDERISEMKENITHLQEVNRDLNAKLSRFRDMEEVTVNQIDSPLEKVQRLSAKLQEKDQELERKIDKILALDEQLNAEARFQTILDDMKCDFTFSRKFSEGLAELEEGSRQLAIIVGQCLSNKRVKNLRKKPRRQPELSKFITDTIGQIGQLVSNPTSCIRALIFGFVRERIFFSDCWTALHYDGYMLRELQDVIQKMCPQNTLESLHKAAIESMLSRDTGFEQCWIKAEVEDNQHQFLELLSPLFDHQELEDMRHQIERDLRVLFTGAFKTRSRLFAPTGFRFQLVQFKPGVEFDPEYMRVQRESATVSKSPDNKLHRVKACIHGCLLKYSEQEEPLTLDTDVIKRLSQPLGRSETSQPTGSGTLMSDKAIVILED